MKSLFKRVAVGALAAAMLLSTGLTAMARDVMTDMEFVAFQITEDVTNSGYGVKVEEIYNEIRDGRLTGKQLKQLVDNSRLSWEFEAYEDVYPYAAYECLYIDGVKQANITRYTGKTPKWASKRQAYAWDILAPHNIWERQMTKVNGTTWTWDFGNARFGIDDSAVYKKTEDKVVPAVDYVEIGTANFDLEGKMLYTTNPNTMDYKFNPAVVKDYITFGEAGAMDAWVAAVNGNGIADEKDIDWESLSARDPETNQYVMSDDDIQEFVPVFYKKLVTAPGERTRDVYATYLADPDADWDLKRAQDTIKVEYDATISWTIPQYELTEPYKEFQFLKVNGIALDGTKDANGNVKPVVGRYTGSLANPKVEWVFHKYGKRVDFAGSLENKEVYEVIECKVLDGKHVLDIFGNHVTRVQTDVYGYGYYKAIPGGVQYRIAMADGTNDIGYTEYLAYTGEVVSESVDELEGVNLWVNEKEVVEGDNEGVQLILK